jgi:uncharacterized protein YjbI with pentapeptide repeats
VANTEHVRLIRREGWNKWRADHPGVVVSLREADLSWADLSGAYLYWADLREAKLIGANVTGADLSGANLTGADLREANLSRAGLRMANLSGAKLGQANFGRANLSGADLTYAVLDETNFGAADLKDAKALESCEFRGPCVLDMSAIQQSGMLPLPFLRGCGLPDLLIENLPALLNDAAQLFSCFISYSTKDKEFADRLYADLQNKGVRCWFAPHGIRGGRKAHEQINEADRPYDKLLLILSDASIASPWVKPEIADARAREQQQKRRMLFPITLVSFHRIKDWKRGAGSAREIRGYFIPDFSNWKDHDSYAKAFERLMRDLKASTHDEATA